jgi:hypothetical protein
MNLLENFCPVAGSPIRQIIPVHRSDNYIIQAQTREHFRHLSGLIVIGRQHLTRGNIAKPAGTGTMIT